MSTRRIALIALSTAAAFAATAGAALGAGPLVLESRNPGGGTAAGQETQIIASTARDTYATRQSNKGAGGGAIYGCRTTLLVARPGDPTVSTPCLRVNNLTGGKAFDFVFDDGPLGGIIQSGGNLLAPNPRAAPFVTNATAVALGLNADRLDGRHAAEIISTARLHDGLDADTLDGRDASAIISAARDAASSCPTGTAAAAGTCLETSARPAATYTAATAACGAAGRRLATVSTLMYARTLPAFDLGGGEMAGDVTVPAAAELPVVGTLSQPPTYATVAEDGTVGGAALTAPAAFRCSTPT